MSGIKGRVAATQAEKDADAKAKAEAEAKAETEAAEKKAADEKAEEEAKAKEEADKKAKADKAAKDKKAEDDEEEEEMAAKAAAAKAADPVAIAEACAAAGVSSLTGLLIKSGLSVEELGTRVETAKEVKALFARAESVNSLIDAGLADQLNADGISVESAKAILGVMLPAMQSPEINGNRSVDGSPDHGWGDVIAKNTQPHLRKFLPAQK